MSMNGGKYLAVFLITMIALTVVSTTGVLAAPKAAWDLETEEVARLKATSARFL